MINIFQERMRIKMNRGFLLIKDELLTYREEDILIPKRATKYSAGYDFYLPCNVVLKAKKKVQVKTNLKAYMKKDEVLFLFIRSSYAIKKGITLTNNVGIIDSDYFSNEDNDGEIIVSLTNNTDKDIYLKRGDRFIQGIFLKYLTVDGDTTTKLRKGGIGSTK